MQADRVDRSAVGFDYQGKTEKHESQKGALLLPWPHRYLGALGVCDIEINNILIFAE